MLMPSQVLRRRSRVWLCTRQCRTSVVRTEFVRVISATLPLAEGPDPLPPAVVGLADDVTAECWMAVDGCVTLVLYCYMRGAMVGAGGSSLWSAL